MPNIRDRIASSNFVSRPERVPHNKNVENGIQYDIAVYITPSVYSVSYTELLMHLQLPLKHTHK